MSPGRSSQLFGTGFGEPALAFNVRVPVNVLEIVGYVSSTTFTSRLNRSYIGILALRTSCVSWVCGWPWPKACIAKPISVIISVFLSNWRNSFAFTQNSATMFVNFYCMNSVTWLLCLLWCCVSSAYQSRHSSCNARCQSPRPHSGLMCARNSSFSAF